MAGKKDASTVPPELLDLYRSVAATVTGVEVKGATVPYTSLNGHMFSYLAKDGTLALRLPEEEREPFLKKYRTSLCVAYGVVQKEYVVVPEKLLQNTKELSPHFRRSLEYVKSLKPKGNTGGKKAKKRT